MMFGRVVLFFAYLHVSMLSGGVIIIAVTELLIRNGISPFSSGLMGITLGVCASVVIADKLFNDGLFNDD